MQVIVLPRHSRPKLLCKSPPAIWAKDNATFSSPTSAEGEKPGYQHLSGVCKHSSLGEIRGLSKLGVVINDLLMEEIVLVKTVPTLARADSRSLPTFPPKSLVTFDQIVMWVTEG